MGRPYTAGMGFFIEDARSDSLNPPVICYSWSCFTLRPISSMPGALPTCR